MQKKDLQKVRNVHAMRKQTLLAASGAKLGDGSTLEEFGMDQGDCIDIALSDEGQVLTANLRFKIVVVVVFTTCLPTHDGLKDDLVTT